ncbi:MAG TPA: ATP-dependent helicase, partial [Coxiellaceae bacterium]|nr:ATP-dependent helicase [Coxiellaceae bacterium]
VLASSVEPEYADYLEQLLLHLDNDWQMAEKLFITMLKSREQWLPHIVGLKNAKELRQSMESALRTIAQENHERCLELFPQETQEELRLLLNFSKDNHEKPPYFLQKIDFEAGFYKMDLHGWWGMAEFLLTKEFYWRKKVTKEHGFPAQASGSTKEEKELFKSMKTRMEELLLKLCEHENFRASLENLLFSPPPNYDDQQWKIIEALLELLPLLAAQLKVLFNERGLTDYAEISMAALRALGDSELPSELALNLDYQLQHLLIDEFQDTSVAQYRLVEKLIASWQQDDGRTLFVVGDPMQSIYRFREAEVGLFLRSQHEGIGSFKLHPLTLTTNFRSNKNIIDWINDNFSKILPVIADISFGAVPFRPSVAIKQDQNSQIKIELIKNADASAEAVHVVDTLKNLQQQDPEASIAILVKARSHLQKITAAMRNANLDFQAYELETLRESVVVRDLFALTRALFHPADRIAWLAILRAPWCGLSLKDLHQVANGSSKVIWDNVCNYRELDLSTDGKLLIERFKQAVMPIFAQRGRRTWRELVEEAWHTIGGPATVANESELEHAEIYLELLSSNSIDIETIQKKLSELYTPSMQSAKIQIMTIHKAKGLEFDHVIIPGINRTTRLDERKLMLWFERPKLHHGSSLLLAPIGASGNNDDPVYQYLQVVEQKKGFYETGRLLYVAMTRAKKSINIVGCIKKTKEEKNSITHNIQSNSLLEQLKTCFDEDWIKEEPLAYHPRTPLSEIQPKISRLSKEWQLPINIEIPPSNNSPKWQLIDNQKTIIGTVIHYCLRQVSESNLETWDSNHIIKQQPYWHKLLQQAGYIDTDHGLKLINDAITLTLKDERGRWILMPHEKAASELAITTKINNKFENYIIDRTFIDENGVRWIIDYKVSQPTTKNIEEFLNQELVKYSEQLKNYAQSMTALEPGKTIKLGLYFPLFSGWVEMGVLR